jgi:hypothetical protein
VHPEDEGFILEDRKAVLLVVLPDKFWRAKFKECPHCGLLEVLVLVAADRVAIIFVGGEEKEGALAPPVGLSVVEAPGKAIIPEVTPEEDFLLGVAELKFDVKAQDLCLHFFH